MTKDLEKKLGIKNYIFFMGLVDIYINEMQKEGESKAKSLSTDSLGDEADSYVNSFLNKELKDESNYGSLFAKFSNIDPIAIAEDVIIENLKNKGESLDYPKIKEMAMGAGFFLMRIKTKVVNEIVSKLNDTLFSDTIENQSNVAESLGFSKIFEASKTKVEKDLSKDSLDYYRGIIPDSERVEFVEDGKLNISFKEYFYIYYNKEDGSLLTMDSYNNTDRNGANIYFSGYVKDGSDNREKFYSIGMGRGAEYTPDGNFYSCNLDVREGFAVQYIQLKDCFDFKNRHTGLSYYHFSSHIFKEDEMKINKEFILENVFKKMPKDVLEDLIDYNMFRIIPDDNLKAFDYSEKQLTDLIGRETKGVTFKNFVAKNMEKYKDELLMFLAREVFQIQPDGEKKSKYAFSALENFKSDFLNESCLSDDDFNYLSASIFYNRRDFFEKCNLDFNNVVKKMVEDYDSKSLNDKMAILSRDGFISDLRFNAEAKDLINEVNSKYGLPSISEIAENKDILNEIKEVNKLKKINKLN